MDTESGGGASPPFDREAESALIGAIILSGGVGDQYKEITQTISPSDIWTAGYRDTYQAILDIPKPFDLVILKDKLAELRVLNDRFTIGDLAATVETVPSAAHAIPYAKIVRRKAGQRKVAAISSRIAEKSAKGVELNGEEGELAEAIRSLNSQGCDLSAPSVPAAVLDGLDLGSVDWLMEPLFGRGLMTFIQGKPKGGKSVFALYAALCMAKGVWVSDRFSISKPARGIYLHYEDNLRRVQDRIIRYNRPLMLGGLPETLFLFERPPRFDLATGAGIATLRKLIERDKADFVVLDTLAKVHSADENSQSEMQPIMTALRDITIDYRLSMIVIHHTRKTGSQGDVGTVSDKGRGSGSIAAEADVILDWGSRVAPNLTYCQLISKEDPGSDEFNVRYVPQEDETVRWIVEDVTDREDAIEAQHKIQQALESLFASGTTEAQFQDVKILLPGMSDQTVRNHLKVLTERGKVIRRRADELPRKPWLYTLKA